MLSVLQELSSDKLKREEQSLEESVLGNSCLSFKTGHTCRAWFIGLLTGKLGLSRMGVDLAFSALVPELMFSLLTLLFTFNCSADIAFLIKVGGRGKHLKR